MRSIGVMGLSVARPEIDNFAQKNGKQTIKYWQTLKGNLECYVI